MSREGKCPQSRRRTTLLYTTANIVAEGCNFLHNSGSAPGSAAEDIWYSLITTVTIPAALSVVSHCCRTVVISVDFLPRVVRLIGHLLGASWELHLVSTPATVSFCSRSAAEVQK